MRVAMIAFSNFEYTIELTEALAEIEDVTLMIPGKTAERFGKVISSGLKIYSFNYPRMRYPTNVLMIFDIVRKLRELKPEIVHLQKGHPWFNCVLPMLRRYCLITTIHDVILLDWPSQRIPKFTYLPPIKFSNQLIVHGEKLKEVMVREYKRSSEDVHVMKRGVNSIYARYMEGEVKEEKNRIMYFGRIWGYKGIEYLIQAEPIISSKVPDVKIVIAGVGEDIEKYKQMMVHKDKFILYNEYIPDNRVNELFQKACIVVLPYIDGSQSGVIPQAYAFRKPVVITDVGSLPENVEEGVTGYIVPPRDSNKLAEAIIDLLTDDEKRNKMGENAYKKTEEELLWKNIARKTVEVYKKALSTGNKGERKIRTAGIVQ